MNGLTRRQFVQGVGLGLLAGCGRLPGPAQSPTKVPRIGYLQTRIQPALYDALKEGLREYGYVERQNIVVVERSADTESRSLAELAAELIQEPVDLIVASGSPAAIAVRQASTTVPIVMALGDPVGSGLAASLARPGGTVTGVTNLAPLLGAKRLELLKESVPGLTRVAVLWPPYNPVKQAEWTETREAGRALGVHLHSLEVHAAEDLEHAFATATREQAEALIVFGDNLTNSHAPRIVALAARHGLPTMYESRAYTDAGGLIAYGPSFAGLFRRAAYYVDRILKGAKPADLPIEQPREFDFIINLKTAQALGLTIPHHVLLQATEVLE